MTGYSNIAYTPAVVAQQELHGSAPAIARSSRGDAFERISDAERAFIALRDEFYLATVGATGWPYVQYKSGATGFVSVDRAGQVVRYTEVPGNRQYISFGNISENPRVSLFFIDYARRMRLKLLGLAELQQRIVDDRVTTTIEITVTATDWNCPKSIIQRFSLAEVAALCDDK